MPRVPGKRQRLARAIGAGALLPIGLRLRRLWRLDLPILAYHRVREIDSDPNFSFDLELVSATPAQFRAQMLMVRRNFTPVGFADVARALAGGDPLPRDPIIVSFDDGYDDNHAQALPILRELGLRATFFVSSGHIDSGRPFAYDWLVHVLCTAPDGVLELPHLTQPVELRGDREARRRLGHRLLDRMKGLADRKQGEILDRLAEVTAMPCARDHLDCRPMGWAEVRQLRDAGMEVGSHGVHHRMLAKLDDAGLAWELLESKARIERELGAPCIAISYPVGGPDAYDERVIAATRAAGYQIACSYEPGIARQRSAADERFALRRLAVEREFDLDMVAGMLMLPEVFSYPSRPKRV